MVNITQLLQMMVQKEASDIFFTAGARISMKIDGALRPISLPELTPETSKQLARHVLRAAGCPPPARPHGSRR